MVGYSHRLRAITLHAAPHCGWLVDGRCLLFSFGSAQRTSQHQEHWSVWAKVPGRQQLAFPVISELCRPSSAGRPIASEIVWIVLGFPWVLFSQQQWIRGNPFLELEASFGDESCPVVTRSPLILASSPRSLCMCILGSSYCIRFAYGPSNGSQF